MEHGASCGRAGGTLDVRSERSGAVSAHHLDRARFVGKEVMTGSIVPGLTNTFAVGKDGSLSNRYAAVLAAHAGTVVCWNW